MSRRPAHASTSRPRPSASMDLCSPADPARISQYKFRKLEMKTPIYLDNHATTRTDPRVLAAMLPYFTEYFGNAASRNHEFGWTAEQAVDKARKQIADLIGATPREV